MIKRHPILKSFLSNREQSPQGTELTQGVTGRVYNLHAKNPHRGVTWFDEALQVVFLLAVTNEHDYTKFEQLSKDGKLMPTPTDYVDFDEHYAPNREDMLADIQADAQPLIEQAFETPGTQFGGTLANRFPADIELEAIVINDEWLTGDLYVAVRPSADSPRRPIERQLLSDIADALFPDANPSDVFIDTATFPEPRGYREGDHVFIWKQDR